MQVTVTAVDWSDPEGSRLRAQQEAELRERYDGAPEPDRAPGADDVAVFLVARDRATGAAVACGALRPLDGGAEIKRLFVVPEHRGQGLARLVLAELEHQARALGWLRLRLETGERQPEALALYRGAGYVPVPAEPDNGLAGSIHLAKRLDPA